MPDLFGCVFSTNIATLGPFLTVAASIVVLVNVIFFGYLLKNYIKKNRMKKKEARIDSELDQK